MYALVKIVRSNSFTFELREISFNTFGLGTSTIKKNTSLSSNVPYCPYFTTCGSSNRH